MRMNDTILAMLCITVIVGLTYFLPLETEGIVQNAISAVAGLASGLALNSKEKKV